MSEEREKYSATLPSMFKPFILVNKTYTLVVQDVHITRHDDHDMMILGDVLCSLVNALKIALVVSMKLYTFPV